MKMLDVPSKKKKVSKKTRSSWRKHVDFKDVDNFLDKKRLEERLGLPLSQKSDHEIFRIDTNRSTDLTSERSTLTKSEHRLLLKNTEPRCYSFLKPLTAVPDPITKRNFVKKKCLPKLKKGVSSLKNSAENKKFSKLNNDIWEVNEMDSLAAPIIKNEWLTNDAKRHNLANTGKIRKRVPNTLKKKTSVVPAVIPPHPGTSYNPSYSDHQQLLADVAADELKFIKEEKHLDRVTSKMFRRITQEEKESSNLKEMSEGLPLPNSQENSFEYSNDSDDSLTVKSINPPSKNIKKTAKQRRKQKELKESIMQNLKTKVEKKKIADIYKLNKIDKHLSKLKRKEEVNKEKKNKYSEKKQKETKQLSKNKFEPVEPVFQLGEELAGNLRSSNPAGNLLKDRYKSLQQRNIVAPGTLVLKRCKAKVKRFIKPDHKIDFHKLIK